MKTIVFWLGASALAIGSCQSAWAQATAGSGNENAETVVVTAERRTENLMTTPITASVLSGDELQNRGALTINDLQFIAPSVTINDFGQGVDFDIRGIGKGEHNTQTPIGVVTYHDGASTFQFVLAGDLSGAAVEELAWAWETAQSILASKELIVDISKITGADLSGNELLSRMRESGARLTAPAPPASEDLVRSFGLPAAPSRDRSPCTSG